ncbi:hypothetical protein CA13_65390 [Planctomycetes bacterium CA13]|uniref:Glycosyl hydrolases family 2, sugar binding domain n=1 Tax=Novipirellula herctigrandis TaxID=2527986 RepID=A0A5C5ZDA7_9BACT|nr:hypothetical protein CA13_65390 [Planctomycetes bacterium CA13]
MITRPRLRSLVFFPLVMVFAYFTAAVGHAEDNFAEVERHFRELPMEARYLTGPLYWLHGDESKATLEHYVEKIAEGGNGCFTAESRPHNDWLGEGWYRDLEICLDAAKRAKLKMWIFDEEWWPSQMVGGHVPPEYGSKYLESEQKTVTGPQHYEIDEVGGPHFVAVVAGQADSKGRIDDATLIDLEPSLDGDRLVWDVPAGRWSIMTFRWRYAGAQGHQRQWISVDGASKDCVDWFLKTVYQPHFDRFGDDFGNTIAGYFYDEPETQGDWGTEVIPEIQRRGVDWKAVLVAKQFQLQDPEQQTAAAYQYQDAFAEAWGRTMYGGISDWCREHQVKSIGHFMEHGELYLRPTFCAGNMFQLQKYTDMGGIDLVLHQMYPGERPLHVYQTPKLASSISHAYGKKDDLAMCEIYGGYDQTVTYPQMKWLADQHQVRGVNFMVPHSFNPRAPYDHDCPPYFYNNGNEPRWPLYRVWADYTNRLSTMLSGGHHVCPVALLYLGNSFHAGKSITPENMTSALQDALFDCDWMPYDAFENDTQIADANLLLHDERYRVLVLPAAEVLPYETLAKAKEFCQSGGVVVAYGILPTASATLNKDASDITQLREAIFGQVEKPGLDACQVNANGGRSYFLPEQPTTEQIQQVLAVDAGIHPTLEVLDGQTDDWLHVLHRVKAGRDVFFVANQQHEGSTKTFRLRIRAGGVPEAWDAMRNAVNSVPFKRIDDDVVELNLTLEPLESVLLVFSPEARDLPVRITPADKPVQTPLAVTRVATPVEKIIPSQPVVEEADRSLLIKSHWVWYPEANAQEAANPGTRYFRNELTLPIDAEVIDAKMCLTADNSWVLFANGHEVGKGDNWRRSTSLNLTKSFHAGRNILAIAATNGTDSPSPAGLIGCCRITLADGQVMIVRIDETWKAELRHVDGWNGVDFDDRAWDTAKTLLPYGGQPWGQLGDAETPTISPVQSDPFVGRVTVPNAWLDRGLRIVLEADSIVPEAAAAITVNGQKAGGFIGAPLRVDVSAYLKAGENTIEIDPLAPAGVRLAPFSQ